MIRGTATITASAPKRVRRIVVRVYGVGNHHVWKHVDHGHRLQVRLNVEEPAIWGINRRVSSTYGEHRLTVTFQTACGSQMIALAYMNNDPPRRTTRTVG